MKIYTLFSLLIVFFLSLQAQPGFIKTYDITPEGNTNYLDVLIDNDTIILYSVSKNSIGKWGIRFAKLDSFGTVLQERIHVDSADILTTTFFRKKIIKTKDGGYAIFGSALSTNKYKYLLKVNHDLSLDFIQRYYPQTDSLYVSNSSLVETSDGYMLTGYTRDLTSPSNPDLYVIKTDKQGNEIWRKIYDTPNTLENVFEIKILDDNTFVLAAVRGAWISQQAGWNRSVLMCIDSTGAEKWVWESEAIEEMGGIFDFEQLPDGGWVFLASTSESNIPNIGWAFRPTVYRLDKDFNVLWYWIYDKYSSHQFWSDLERTKDGNFIASGYLFEEGKIKAAHYKFTPEGDSLWLRQDSVASFNRSMLMGTDILSSGSIVSVGYGEYGDINGSYGFVMKLSSDGCIDMLNCWPVANEVVLGEADISVYPNPFRDVLTISLLDYAQKEAYIHFYDVMGRILRKERIRHGVNELRVDDFPSGMIFYEVVDRGMIVGRGKLVKD